MASTSRSFKTISMRVRDACICVDLIGRHWNNYPHERYGGKLFFWTVQACRIWRQNSAGGPFRGLAQGSASNMGANLGGRHESNYPQNGYGVKLFFWTVQATGMRSAWAGWMHCHGQRPSTAPFELLHLLLCSVSTLVDVLRQVGQVNALYGLLRCLYSDQWQLDFPRAHLAQELRLGQVREKGPTHFAQRDDCPSIELSHQQKQCLHGDPLMRPGVCAAQRAQFWAGRAEAPGGRLRAVFPGVSVAAHRRP